MRRREFIGLIGVAAGWACPAWGQAKVPHVVYLWLGSVGSDDSIRKGLQTGMRELGYREGQDVVVRYSYANGKEERLAEHADAAVAGQPEVIVTPGSVVTRAVKRRTSTIPVVSVSGDPVGAGFITSLARPGGNITGLIQVGPELAGKWLELILEIVPRAACRLADKCPSTWRAAPIWSRCVRRRTAWAAMSLSTNAQSARQPTSRLLSKRSDVQSRMRSSSITTR